MSAITQHDYRAMLACIARHFECEAVEQFASVSLAEIPRLVGSDHSTFNYVAPAVPKVKVVAAPAVSNHANRQKTFARYASQHPVLNHYLASGDGGAYKISDFQSEREYHSLPLYQDFYRELRYEDQMAIELFAPASELISIAFARDRRSFTEREREILNLLRPHLARAYRHVERVELLKRGLDHREPAQRAARVTAVLLDTKNRPVQFGAEAQEWMQRFFKHERREESHLPEAVTDWLRRTANAGSRRSKVARRWDRLERANAGERLQLRVIFDPATATRMLVLGLETEPATARAALGARLTPREIDVLLQVELGKSNDEIGAALGISSLTVRTHLEHIFDKLHVPSRTAAVTQFRRLCACSI